MGRHCPFSYNRPESWGGQTISDPAAVAGCPREVEPRPQLGSLPPERMFARVCVPTTPLCDIPPAATSGSLGFLPSGSLWVRKCAGNVRIWQDQLSGGFPSFHRLRHGFVTSLVLM